MKILGLNCHGLGGAAAVLSLLDVQKRRGADVIFLSETHLDEFPAECLRRRLRMDHKYVVRSDGRSGGLMLMWKKEIGVDLLFKCDNYIDVIIGRGVENIWRFTGMYGEPKWENKYLTWDYLRNLHAQCNMPWLVLGDLNEILYPFEKEGGNPRPLHFMQAFRDALVDCDLSDLGYVGDKFTWHRGHIRERLDRALSNEAWNNKFPHAVLENLPYCKSDHRPILLSLEEQLAHEHLGPKVLRFEAKWLKEAQFKDIVQQAWEQSGADLSNTDLAGRLSAVHKQLHKWDRYTLQRSKKRIRAAQRELEQVAVDDLSDENIEKQKQLALEIERLLEQEEIHWAQRSRVNWLQFGDKNTSYFHRSASTRRERNRIKRLRNDQGAWLEGTAYLNPMISDYFFDAFSTEVYDTDPELLSKVNPRVTNEMNEVLQ
ncbi:uncharacterized protein [Lolium perenne]|uniref:uncharacterized protein n=1 Tax=Lolium perenne TaxID=4522 RepID=UPI003A99C12F